LTYLGTATSDSVKENVYNEDRFFSPGYLIRSYSCQPTVATGRWQQLLPFTIQHLLTYLGTATSDSVKENVYNEDRFFSPGYLIRSYFW
jgi:hypothetical protein